MNNFAVEGSLWRTSVTTSLPRESRHENVQLGEGKESETNYSPGAKAVSKYKKG